MDNEALHGKRFILILGGARSGKSRFALELGEPLGKRRVFVATALPSDEEMARRIERHRRERPEGWKTMEEPLRLVDTLQAVEGKTEIVVIDCLTLWLSNLLGANDPELLPRERRAFQGLLPQLPGHIILVSNETGLGIVPLGALSRRFCDEAGWLHQDLAQQCDRVLFTVAGLPQLLKGKPLI